MRFKMVLKYTLQKQGVKRQFSQDSVELRAFVNMVINLRVP
jgi:hypothetical protein